MTEMLDAGRNKMKADQWTYHEDGSFGRSIMVWDFNVPSVTTYVPHWDFCFSTYIPFSFNLTEKIDSMMKPGPDNVYVGKQTPKWSSKSFDVLKYTDFRGTQTMLVNENSDAEYIGSDIFSSFFYHAEGPMVEKTFTDADFTIPECDGKVWDLKDYEDIASQFLNGLFF
jgi:hypothetical protein